MPFDSGGDYLQDVSRKSDEGCFQKLGSQNHKTVFCCWLLITHCGALALPARWLQRPDL